MTSSKKLLQIIGGLAVLALGGAVWLWYQVKEAGDMWPHEGVPGSITQQISGLRGDIAGLETEVAKIPAAKEQLEIVRKEYEIAISVLPQENNPSELLGAIEAKAQQAGVIPVKFTPNANPGGGTRPSQNAGAFQEWTFQLDLRGSYDQIGTFINRMEEFDASGASGAGSGKRFFQVSDIVITAAESGLASLNGGRIDETSVETMHNCNLTMQTFRFTGN